MDFRLVDRPVSLVEKEVPSEKCPSRNREKKKGVVEGIKYLISISVSWVTQVASMSDD